VPLLFLLQKLVRLGGNGLRCDEEASETIALGEDCESQHSAAQENAPYVRLIVAPERAQAQGSIRPTHDPKLEGGELAVSKVPAQGAHAMIQGR